MATIYNSQLSREIQTGAKLQVIDKAPTQLADKVVPVMEVNPKLLRRARILGRSLSTAVSTTLLTSSANQDTYLTGALLSYTKDATNQSTQIDIRTTIDGATTRIVELATLTLTAQSGSIYADFSKCPIKIDRGVVVTVNQEATANIRSAAIVYGYVDEQSNA